MNMDIVPISSEIMHTASCSQEGLTRAPHVYLFTAGNSPLTQFPPVPLTFAKHHSVQLFQENAESF